MVGKKLKLIWLMSLLPYFGVCQEETVVQAKKSGVEDVYIVVDTPPRFKGGDKKLQKFFKKNCKFQITENRTEGLTVYFQFVVNTEGKAVNLNFLRSPSLEVQNEVERIFGLMPDWIPGIKNDKAVSVRITKELSFIID